MEKQSTVTVYSRSNNDILFERMKSFIPENIEVVKCDQFNGWEESAEYLYHIIDTCPTQYAVNIDIDCFVYDWSKVEEIIKSGPVYFGMPETKSYHPGRNFCSSVMNPFFNIFNVEEIRKIKGYISWDQISNTPIPYSWKEPFHPFFQWLSDHTTGIAMETKTEPDQTTVNDFLIHTWYSRMYGGNSLECVLQTERIDEWYFRAKYLKNENIFR